MLSLHADSSFYLHVHHHHNHPLLLLLLRCRRRRFVVWKYNDIIVISFNILRDSITKNIPTTVPLAPRFSIRIPLIDGLVRFPLKKKGRKIDVEMLEQEERILFSCFRCHSITFLVFALVLA